MSEAQASVESSKISSGKFFSVLSDHIFAVAVIVVILFMFIPLGKVAIDIAMVLNLAISFIILLTVIYLRRSADFSTFPQVVLFATLFGLAINISSTRNILIHPVVGSSGRLNMNGQSEMVQTFANIVAGDNVVVGFIIFIILIVVQMLVVTKGADRVTEVSARFTLDAMNNKMFDIQNDLNAGLITDEEAKRRKALLNQEIGFYSAMDGSSKFVSGNVKAGIFITVVNLIGGIITGMIAGLGPMDALNAYAKLTIGDGLMSQLPALMLSFATGLLVTGNSGSNEFLPDEIKKQFSIDGTIYIIVGATLAVMGLAFHNSSAFILIPGGALLIFFGIRMKRVEDQKKEAEKIKAETALSSKQTGSSPDEISPLVTPDALSLDLGYALIPLVDKDKGAELLERVTKIRKEQALDLGLVVPPIRIRDSMALDPEQYSFKIRGIEAGSSHLKIGYYMCINMGPVPKNMELTGEATKDPAFGMDAIWIPESKRQEAERAGYAVIDPPTIIATHLTEIIRKHAAEILSRQEVSSIITKLKETNQVVVDEVTSGEYKFSYGEIEAVLRNLLSEQVSIRNMVTILETLGDYGKYTHDPYVLTEKVREALGAQICLQYADENKVLNVITISQSLCEMILSHGVSDQPGKKPFVAFDPVDGRKYINAMSSTIAQVREKNYYPVILCPSEVRMLVKSSIERELPGVVVISHSEVLSAGAEIKINSIGEVNAI